MLSLLGLLGRAVVRFCARAFAAALEAKELEEAPGRLGFRTLWRLDEHSDLLPMARLGTVDLRFHRQGVNVLIIYDIVDLLPPEINCGMIDL